LDENIYRQGYNSEKLLKTGVKNVLVQHLLTPQNAPPPPPRQNISVTNESRNINTADDANHRSINLQASHPNARWRESKHSGACQEPERPANLRGPSVPADESELQKYELDEEWDLPPFTSMSKVIELGSRGHSLADKKDETLYEDEARNDGWANFEWIRKKGLIEDSLPHEWFEALLLSTPKLTDPASTVSLFWWTLYANLRVSFAMLGLPVLSIMEAIFPR
jgi:hypothetical protein